MFERLGRAGSNLTSSTPGPTKAGGAWVAGTLSYLRAANPIFSAEEGISSVLRLAPEVEDLGGAQKEADETSLLDDGIVLFLEPPLRPVEIVRSVVVLFRERADRVVSLPVMLAFLAAASFSIRLASLLSRLSRFLIISRSYFSSLARSRSSNFRRAARMLSARAAESNSERLRRRGKLAASKELRNGDIAATGTEEVGEPIEGGKLPPTLPVGEWPPCERLRCKSELLAVRFPCARRNDEAVPAADVRPVFDRGIGTEVLMSVKEEVRWLASEGRRAFAGVKLGWVL